MRKVKIIDFYQIIKSYFEDFPKHERKSLFLLLQLYYANKIEILVLKDANIGFVICNISNPDLILIDYFAIFKKYRSKGNGSLFLKKLDNYYQKSLILEVEIPKNLAQENRIKFYEKNGFNLSNVYSTYYKEELRIMTKPSIPDDDLVIALSLFYQLSLDNEVVYIKTKSTNLK